MASINGVAATGLMPPVLREQPKLERKATEEKVESKVRLRCEFCNGMLTDKERKRFAKAAKMGSYHIGVDLVRGIIDTELCHYCNTALSCCNSSYQDALALFEKLRAGEYVMLMRSLSLGSPSGLIIGLDFGDCFRASRISGTITNLPNKTTSWSLATLDILVANMTVTLLPGEVESIPWLTLMKLRDEGDYETAYTSKDDAEGYWSLTAKAKKAALRAFGER